MPPVSKLRPEVLEDVFWCSSEEMVKKRMVGNHQSVLAGLSWFCFVVSKSPWRCVELFAILHLYAARHSLTGKKYSFISRVLLWNFLPPNKFVGGRVLAVQNGGLAMERVATVNAEILMFVHGLSIKVCTNLAILEEDRCVQKCYFFSWPGGIKFYGGVVKIKALNEAA